MPFVPGFQVDVFVSYATVNDQTTSGSKDNRGWVTAVRDTLKPMLDEGLGRKDAGEVWMDYKLRGNEPFDEALRDKVANSAVMLVFLSEGYLMSEWCRRELEIFADANDGERGRIFLVHYESVPPLEWPPQLQGLSSAKYKFYEQERDGDTPNLLGWPLPIPNDPCHQSFYRRMRELRQDMVRKLKELKRSRPQPASALSQRPLVTAAQPPAAQAPASQAPPAQPNVEPNPDPQATQSFIGELLVAAICHQLNSGREPFRTVRDGLIRQIKDDPHARGEVDADALTRILAEKLNDVVQEIYKRVRELNTREHVDDLRSLTASVAAAAVNKQAMETLKQQLDDGHLRVPEFANLPLCEAVFTALFQEPAVGTTERAIDQQQVFAIETAATLTASRNREIRRRVVDLYFSHLVPRGAGQSEADYSKRLDDFAARELPTVLQTALEDQEPWFILFVDTASTVTLGFANDPDFWRHVIKVESTPDGNDVILPDMGPLRERLRKIYEHFDKLQGNK